MATFMTASSLSSSGESLLSADPFPERLPVHPLHPSNFFDVEGLVVVITGGGTGKWSAWSLDRQTECSIGIGLMMAKALENNGATVYIIGRRLDILQMAARENNVRQYRNF